MAGAAPHRVTRRTRRYTARLNSARGDGLACGSGAGSGVDLAAAQQLDDIKRDVGRTTLKEEFPIGHLLTPISGCIKRKNYSSTDSIQARHTRPLV